MKTSLSAILPVCLTFLLFAAMESGQIACAQFTDYSVVLGEDIVPTGSPHGDGISLYDFNGDGWDDLTISAGDEDPKFYFNNNGVLEPAPFTIPNQPSENISMMLWADYDNDGDADLLITKFGAPVQLWNNDGNFNFTNVAESAGLMSGYYMHVGAAFADYNHDGCLDLYIAKFYHPSFYIGDQYTGRLYMNNCDGTFTDITDSAGVAIPARPCFQPVFLDFNGDGWEDLLLVIDRMFWTNELFKNNGDGTFTNITESSGFDFIFDAMTGTVGDYDNDADLDVFMTNNPSYDFGTVLMKNNGNETFSNVAEDMGVCLFEVTWGSLWLDYDNDSWQDLFVSVTSPVQEHVGNQFFVNVEGQGFSQENALVGIDDDPSETFVCAQGDLNNDGYFDFAINNKSPHPAKIYMNDGGTNNYLSVSLEGTLSNKDGIGSWIHCYTNGLHYVRYTLSGENLIGQNSAKEIFGLGELTEVDSLVVEWNRGTRDVYHNPPINTHHHIVEGMTLTPAFALSSGTDQVLCPGDTILLDAGEFESYLWSTGDSLQQLSVTEPGDYWVEVINTFGNTTTSIPVSIQSAPVPEITWLVDDVSCYGAGDGSIWVEVSTGPTEQFSWNNGDNTPFIDGLGPGIYAFTAIDGNGCFVSDSTEIHQADSIHVIAEVSPVACFGEQTGSVALDIEGGTPPFIINWMGNDPNNMEAGDYEVLVTDWDNCSATANFIVFQPDSMSIEVSTQPATNGESNGSAGVSIDGGTPPYSITWSNGIEDELDISDLAPGLYSVGVEDSNGCVWNGNFEIDIVSQIDQRENNLLVIIYPNPVQSILNVELLNDTPAQITLMDQTGRNISEFSWLADRRTIDLSNLAPGMYLLWIRQGGSSSMEKLLVTN